MSLPPVLQEATRRHASAHLQQTRQALQAAQEDRDAAAAVLADLDRRLGLATVECEAAKVIFQAVQEVS